MKPLRSAPAQRINRGRHRLSSVQSLTFISLDLPWRTFAMSHRLPAGIWLLRRLCPLYRLLACSQPSRVKRCQSSLIPSEAGVAPLSDLLYAGWSTEATLNLVTGVEATSLPLWSWRIPSQFRPFTMTTLPTPVSGVGIGHRACCLSAGLARRLASLSVGIPPQAVPLPDAGHSALLSSLKHDSIE
jgi:hypothetical protein